MKQIGIVMVRAIFWLSLSLYLGGLIVLGAIAAPALFRTLQDVHATAPQFTAMTVENETGGAARQLGGEIFGNILRRFAHVEAACVALLGVTTGLMGYASIPRGWLRVGAALAVLLGICYFYDLTVTNAIWQTRDQWRVAAMQGQTQVAVERHAEFTKLHHRSEQLANLKVFLLLGLLVTGVIAESRVSRLEEPQPR